MEFAVPLPILYLKNDEWPLVVPILFFLFSPYFSKRGWELQWAWQTIEARKMGMMSDLVMRSTQPLLQSCEAGDDQIEMSRWFHEMQKPFFSTEWPAQRENECGRAMVDGKMPTANDCLHSQIGTNPRHCRRAIHISTTLCIHVHWEELQHNRPLYSPCLLGLYMCTLEDGTLKTRCFCTKVIESQRTGRGRFSRSVSDFTCKSFIPAWIRHVSPQPNARFHLAHRGCDCEWSLHRACGTTSCKQQCTNDDLDPNRETNKQTDLFMQPDRAFEIFLWNLVPGVKCRVSVAPRRM